MQRSHFLRTLGLAGVGTVMLSAKNFIDAALSSSSGLRMPIIFIGYWNP